MKLTWHITKKDLRRLTVPLAGFTLLLIAKIGLGLVLRNASMFDGESFNRLALYLQLDAGLESIFAFVLVGLLTLEDPLIGTQAGWRTRPIPSGMLLRSKLLTCALMFGLLPLLIALPWWLICGFGPAQMGPAALEVMVAEFAVVLPSLALAVLADSLARYLSLGLIVVALWTFTMVMGLAYLPGQETLSWGMIQSRSVIIVLLAVVGLTTIIARQFRARTVNISYALWLVLVVAIPLVMLGWPSDVFAPWRAKATDSSELSRGITFTPQWAGVDYFEGTDPDGSARKLQVTLRKEGARDDLVLAPRLFELNWQARSGELHAEATGTDLFDYYRNDRVPIVQRQLGVAQRVIDPETAQWQEARYEEWMKSAKHEELVKRGLIKKASPLPSPEEQRKQFSFSFNLRGTAKFEPPTQKTNAVLTADFVLARPELMMELPVRESGWQTVQGCSVRIARVERLFSAQRFPGQEGLNVSQRRITLVATQPTDGLSPLVFGPTFHFGPPAVLAPDNWALTRDLGEALWGGPLAMGNFGARLDGVQLTWKSAVIWEPRVIRNGNWTHQRTDWVDHVTLAFFRYVIEGAFRRTLQLESIKNARPHP